MDSGSHQGLLGELLFKMGPSISAIGRSNSPVPGGNTATHPPILPFLPTLLGFLFPHSYGQFLEAPA